MTRKKQNRDKGKGGNPSGASGTGKKTITYDLSDTKHLHIGSAKSEYDREPLPEKKPIDPVNPLSGIATTKVLTNIRRINFQSEYQLSEGRAVQQPIYKYHVEISYIFRKSQRAIEREENEAKAKKTAEPKPEEEPERPVRPQHEDPTLRIEIVSESRFKGYSRIRDKMRCVEVFKHMLGRPELKGKGQLFYDRQSAAYSATKFEKIEKTLKNGENANFDVCLCPTFVEAIFKITPMKDKDDDTKFVAVSTSMRDTFHRIPAQINHGLEESLNVMTSHAAYMNVKCITVKNNVHFLIGSVGPHTGIVKSVKPLELNVKNETYDVAQKTEGEKLKWLYGQKFRENEAAAMCLVADTRVTQFHPEKTLYDYWRQFNTNDNLAHNSQEARKFLKRVDGIYCFTNYTGNTVGRRDRRIDEQIVKVAEFYNSAVNSSFERDDGTRMTVQEYYRRTYGINLRAPRLFTVRCGDNVYPLECLKVCPGQTVKNSQMTYDDIKDIISESTVLPSVRRQNTENYCKVLGIDDTDPQQRHYEGLLNFERNGEEVEKAIVLTKPVFEQKSDIKFFEPAKLGKWAIVFNERYPGGDNVKKADVDRLVQGLRSRGLGNISDPTRIDRAFPNKESIDQFFQELVKKEYKYVIFVCNWSSEKERSEWEHQCIKYCEMKYGVLTQQIWMDTFSVMFKKTETRDNVLQKINTKLGGITYNLKTSYLGGENIFVGFDMSSIKLHPSLRRQERENKISSNPVCIGYAANILINDQKYAGGYFYSTTDNKNDVYGPVITQVLVDVLSQIKKTGRKPKKLYIFISGISESNLGLVNVKYKEKVKDALQKTEFLGVQFNIIVASKNHNERLYKKDLSNQVDNVVPGTVVDHHIVNPARNEFYLAGAKVPKGVAKVAKYILASSSETGMNQTTMRKLEQMTYDLCNNHQIIKNSISLPVPLYIAKLYAKRGATIFNFHTEEHGAITIEEASERLTYNNNLRNTRYNA